VDEIIQKPENWHKCMMEMAFCISKMSKDPSTKVGCVIVSPDKRRITVGYNGFPSLIQDKRVWWEQRDKNLEDYCKYDLSNHAEMNAIIQAKTDLSGWSLYVTHQPCLDCARAIVTTGIKNVYYSMGNDKASMDLKLPKVKKLFKMANVKLSQMKLKDGAYSNKEIPILDECEL